MEEKGQLEASIGRLWNEEKQMRLAENITGTRKAATEILKLCFEAKDWKLLNEQILSLSKKRGQLKQAVQSMVQQAMQYIDQTPDLETRIELTKTLKNVSAGKIFDEIERARLTKKLAKIKEKVDGPTKKKVKSMERRKQYLREKKMKKEARRKAEKRQKKVEDEKQAEEAEKKRKVEVEADSGRKKMRSSR